MKPLLIQADARRLPLTDECVDCVVTSPPYWGMRDYGVESQIGLENQVDCMGWATGQDCGYCWVCDMRAAFKEIWRVLKPQGTVWLNLGDGYASRPNGSIGATTLEGSRHSQAEYRRTNSLRKKGKQTGLKHKDLIGQPWRLAFALQSDGWTLRSEIIWHKPNPMPESVKDRPGKAHETIFLLSKSERYFYDSVSIAVPAACGDHRRNGCSGPDIKSPGQPKHAGLTKIRRHGYEGSEKNSVRNIRTVWTIATQPRSEAHFATFPENLVEPCILAGTSARGVCSECGKPWVRKTKARFHPQSDVSPSKVIRGAAGQKSMANENNWAGFARGTTEYINAGWCPSCDCGLEPVPALVLDPFSGAGTTCRVAERLGRRGVGVELSPEYNKIAHSFCSRPIQRKLMAL